MALLLPWLAALALCAAPAAQEPERARAWRADAEFLARELVRLHPQPFFALPRAEFEDAVAHFADAVEGWDDERATAEFLRLVALVSRAGGDGHTAAWPLDAAYWPLQLYGFADGWFVVAAGAGHEALVGARVEAIAGRPIEELCAGLAPFLSKDNDWSLRARTALALCVPALLRGAGLAREAEPALRLRLRDGRVQEVRLPTEARAELRPWGGRYARSLPCAGGARWLTGREQAFRAEVLEAEHALYVQYNAVLPRDEAGRTLADFAAELVRTVKERELERVVLDLRSNAGGDSSTFGPLLSALADPALDRPGALFALTGRATFSAGGNFTAALRAATHVQLVGEPMGAAPDHFGDAEELELPHHRALFLRISTREHRHARPGADARVLAPDLEVALSSADYFAGRDPVLARALAAR